MIETEAMVSRVRAGQVWVKKIRQPACGTCARHCPAALLEEGHAGTTIELAIVSSLELHPGDRVMVGIAEDAFLEGVVSVYLVPLLGLLAGALAGQVMGRYWFPETAELAAIGGGLVGLIGTFTRLPFKHGPSAAIWPAVVLRKL